MIIEKSNVKFTPGEYYCSENSDYSINVVGVAAGRAICSGWTISTEKIRTDARGNEYIKIDDRTYYAYNK